ncbi:unnamed protein product, partial [Mycena citricolor]
TGYMALSSPVLSLAFAFVSLGGSPATTTATTSPGGWAAALIRSADQPAVHTTTLLPHILLLLSLGTCICAVVIRWTQRHEHTRARSFNAVLAPLVSDSSVAGLGIVRRIARTFHQGHFVNSVNLQQWTADHGPIFNIRMMYQNRIFTTEPSHIKSMLTTNFTSFEKGDEFKSQFRSLMGDGIFNTDGAMWKFHRTISRQYFSKDRILNFRQDYLYNADRAIALLADSVKAGEAVDIQDLAARYTLDCTSEFLFGRSVQSLSASPSCASSSFLHSFAAAQFEAADLSRYGPFWRVANLILGDKVQKHMGVVKQFVDPLIEESLSGDRTGAPEDVRLTLLDFLTQRTKDVDIIRDEVVNMLIGGRDAITLLLTSTIYALADNPPVLQRLQDEVFSAFGTDGVPTLQDLRSLKYIRAVLNESLRLWPVIPVNSRKSTKDAFWPGLEPEDEPYYIPAGTRCSFSTFILHRRPDLWGPDADVYDPDRFLDERYQKYVAPNPYIFLPFSAGPRICMGSQVAYDEAGFFLVRLLQRFQGGISLALDCQPAESVMPPSSREKVRFTSHMSMHCQGGLWVRLDSEP